MLPEPALPEEESAEEDAEEQARAFDRDHIGHLDAVERQEVGDDHDGHDAADEEMGGRCCLVRPGLIVGPHDPSDRFTYWPRRLARGGEVLAPLPRDRQVQFIDVRDCAGFCLTAAEQRLTGAYDVTGPAQVLDFGGMVEACRAHAGADADTAITWVDPDWLLEQEVGPWMEIPLWVPEVDARVDVSPALEKGMQLRPLAETVRDTLAWAEASTDDRPLRAGLAPERETELLAAWQARGEA